MNPHLHPFLFCCMPPCAEENESSSSAAESGIRHTTCLCQCRSSGGQYVYAVVDPSTEMGIAGRWKSTALILPIPVAGGSYNGTPQKKKTVQICLQKAFHPRALVRRATTSMTPPLRTRLCCSPPTRELGELHPNRTSFQALECMGLWASNLYPNDSKGLGANVAHMQVQK